MRLQVEHRTVYRYHQKVRFGRHRLVVRPREGHDLRIERMALAIEPAHHLVWVRDVFGNSIALVDFLDASDTLSIVNDVVVERLLPFPARHLHEPWQVPFPPCTTRWKAASPRRIRQRRFPRPRSACATGSAPR